MRPGPLEVHVAADSRGRASALARDVLQSRELLPTRVIDVRPCGDELGRCWVVRYEREAPA